MKLSLLLLALFLSASCSIRQPSPYEEDLRRLDEVLLHASDYVSAKQQKISTIENLLQSRGVTPLQQYHIYGELYKEYEAFQFDKAKDALAHQIRLADEMGDRSLKYDAVLEKAMLLNMAGYYHEADRIFSQIDTASLNPEQKLAWYRAKQKYLIDYSEYVASAGFDVPDKDKIGYYQSQIIASLPKNSYFGRHLEVLSLFIEGKYAEAGIANIALISTLNKGSRDYAVQAYWQGWICENQGNTFEAVHWWVESAICDIKGAIKDNASLTTLATKLTNPQDTDRAFRYIRSSLEDAAFYNAKLRKVQIATSFPVIEKAYDDSQTRQAQTRRSYLIFAITVALVLAFLCVLVIRLYIRGRASEREIRKKNEQLMQYTESIEYAEDALRKINVELIEANAAKEEYLGLFLSMCSDYLSKLKKTISREQYESELRNFYKTFDTSFLQLYPTFVEDLNALLKEEGRIVLKEGEMLNTELRIFALIRLGITQSSHIASLLRYSVNTIYNYRAQVKNSVLSERENFEDMVRKIGSKRD